MSFVARLRNASKKVAASITAVAAAASLMVVGAGSASALGAGCVDDAVGYGVQRCEVWSPSMGQNITVQIKPAARGGNAAFYLLDGMRATNDASAWTKDVNAPAVYDGDNITLVMPVGGAASFYSDWIAPATYSSDSVNYKWETFLTSELPAYLQANFGIDPTNNSIAGLSMGGIAALNLAARHPEQFKQAMSWSGYLNMTMPGMQTLLRLAMLDVGGFNINAMYGTIISPDRFANDPFWNMDGLRGKDVYISAGNGLAAPADFAAYNLGDVINGAVLESFSRFTTVQWELKARVSGINPTVDYPITGLHNWLQWGYQLNKTHDQVLNVMNAW